VVLTKEDIIKDDNTILEFSWDGNDEMDHVNGRGYAMIENNILVGKIFIQNGDNSKFKAL